MPSSAAFTLVWVLASACGNMANPGGVVKNRRACSPTGSGSLPCRSLAARRLPISPSTTTEQSSGPSVSVDALLSPPFLALRTQISFKCALIRIAPGQEKHLTPAPDLFSSVRVNLLHLRRFSRGVSTHECNTAARAARPGLRFALQQVHGEEP